jgi:hypothetical protein
MRSEAVVVTRDQNYGSILLCTKSDKSKNMLQWEISMWRWSESRGKEDGRRIRLRNDQLDHTHNLINHRERAPVPYIQMQDLDLFSIKIRMQQLAPELWSSMRRETKGRI